MRNSSSISSSIIIVALVVVVVTVNAALIDRIYEASAVSSDVASNVTKTNNRIIAGIFDTTDIEDTYRSLDTILIPTEEMGPPFRPYPVSLRSLKGLDLGSGMAYAFFFRFLRYRLHSINEVLAAYEAQYNIRFPIRKLMLLIPESGYTSPNQLDGQAQWMQELEPVHHLVLDADIPEEYMQPEYLRPRVFKLFHNGDLFDETPRYAIIEDYRPLAAFHDIITQQYISADSTATFDTFELGLYRRLSSRIIHMFYRKLHSILLNDVNEDEEIQNRCELILYQDTTDQGDRVNPAKIILERIDFLLMLQQHHHHLQQQQRS